MSVCRESRRHSVSSARPILLSRREPTKAVRDALLDVSEALALNYAGTLAGQAEAVHQFRISTRKLRAAVELFQPMLDQRWFNLCRNDLKLIGHTIGAMRDRDVRWQTISAASAKIEPALRRALTPIHEALDRQRNEQQEKACALLCSQRYDALIERIPAAPMKEIAQPVITLLPQLIQPLAYKVEQAGARLGPDSAPARFHRLRIKIKRLRYALEMIDDGELKCARKSINWLKRLQDVLGSQHDSVTATAWLHDFAASERIPAATLVAAGALLQVSHRHSVKLTRRAWKGWKKLERRAIIQEAMREVAHYARTSAHHETDRAA